MRALVALPLLVLAAFPLAHAAGTQHDVCYSEFYEGYAFGCDSTQLPSCPGDSGSAWWTAFSPDYFSGVGAGVYDSCSTDDAGSHHHAQVGEGTSGLFGIGAEDLNVYDRSTNGASTCSVEGGRALGGVSEATDCSFVPTLP